MLSCSWYSIMVGRWAAMLLKSLLTRYSKLFNSVKLPIVIMLYAAVCIVYRESISFCCSIRAVSTFTFHILFLLCFTEFRGIMVSILNCACEPGFIPGRSKIPRSMWLPTGNWIRSLAVLAWTECSHSTISNWTSPSATAN